MLDSKTLQLPNPDKIRNQERRNLLITLKQQMENEAKIITPAGNVRYEHTGKHNDLLIALELACHAAKAFIEIPPAAGIAEWELKAGDDKVKNRQANIEWVRQHNNKGSGLRFVVREDDGTLITPESIENDN